MCSDEYNYFKWFSTYEILNNLMRGSYEVIRRITLGNKIPVMLKKHWSTFSIFQLLIL